MIKKLRSYVEQIFDEYPKTKKISELKDELLANLIEKYNDLLSQGKSEEDAYDNVIASIGDINEIINDLNNTGHMNTYDNITRKKNAKYTAVAVMMYILSVVPVIYFEEAWGNGELGVILMFTMVAIATGIIVYANMSKPKYSKVDDTIVEEFKEWKHKKSEKNTVMGAVMSAFWSLIVVIYLGLSFVFDIWAYSWIIFIIGFSISQIIKAIFELKGE